MACSTYQTEEEQPGEDIFHPWLAGKKSLAQRSMALLLLILKERYKVTQAAIDFAVSQVKQTVALLVDDLKETVKKVLKERCSCNSVIHDCFENLDIFEGLHSEYMQSQFYQEHFNLVVS